MKYWLNNKQIEETMKTQTQISRSPSHTGPLLSKLGRPALAVGIAALFLFGVSAQAQNSGTMRPFKVQAIETASIPDPGGLTGTFFLEGEATHLGLFSGVGTYAVTGAAPDGSWVQFAIEVTYTAANGDSITLAGTTVLDYTTSPAVGSGTWEAVEGSGRFEGVTGWGELVSIYNPGGSDPHAEHWASGSINY